MVGGGCPSLLSKLPPLSPINTTLQSGRNARTAVYNPTLLAYLSEPGCAAWGDRQPRHPEHSTSGCRGQSRLCRVLPHSHELPQSLIKGMLSRACILHVVLVLK